MEVEPPFTDEKVRVTVRSGIGEKREDFEEELIGEKKGSIGDDGERVRRRFVVVGARRERVKLSHGHYHLV